MKPNKKNPFGVIGLVDPSEYDWFSQFKKAALIAYENNEVFRVFDVGKIMGLCNAYHNLQQENAELRKQLESKNKKMNMKGKNPTEKQMQFLNDNEIDYPYNIDRQEAFDIIQQWITEMNGAAADYDAENYGDR